MYNYSKTDKMDLFFDIHLYPEQKQIHKMDKIIVFDQVFQFRGNTL